jgi:hypothetical protein
MNYITPVDFPTVPSNLLDSVDDILYRYEKLSFTNTSRKTFSIAEDAPAYDFTRRDVNPDLVEWVKNNIPFKLAPQYQIITTDLPIHKDRTIFSYNYFISTGGANVLTNVFDDNYAVIQSVRIPELEWYRLSSLQFHSVTGVEPNQYRIALSLRMINNLGG